MKKELLIAVFVGLSMGLIITFGIYRVRTSLNDPQLPSFTEETPQDPLATAAPTLITLHNPEDGSIQTTTQLTVTGATTPNVFIVVFVNNEDYISTADDTGNFAVKVQLKQGENTIRVHVVNDEGVSTVEERLVVVTDVFEKLEAAQAELEAQAASASAEAPISDSIESTNSATEATDE